MTLVLLIQSRVYTTCVYTTYLNFIDQMMLLLAVRARKVSALGAMMKGKWWPMADLS